MRLALALVVVAVQATSPSRPARVTSAVPPHQTAAAGQVLLDLTVDERGVVGTINTLRDTPGLTDAIRRAVAGWRFSPATQGEQPVASHVLVAAVFRPPVLLLPGGGESEAAPPPPPGAVPHPITIVPPAYPPNAVGDGVVIVEVEVDAEGAVTRASAVRSSPPFDGPATDAALQWRFQPATTGPALVYVVFGFRQPVF
jgi:TonB family protein